MSATTTTTTTSKVESKLSEGSIVEREGQGALNLLLHPLVIINISDHWTRTKVQTKQANPRVIGALVGKQESRTLEIFNSFELVYDVVDGVVVIDSSFLHQKQEQFKKVFKDYEFMGWYSTGERAQPTDMLVHKVLSEFNENPLYLTLDALGAVSSRELPIHIYESELRMVEDTPTQLFVKVPYKIETGEAERISVDHIARIVPSGVSSGSLLASHLLAVHNAIQMLSTRIQMLTRYLDSVKTGKLPKDHALLRSIASLCNQLPAIDTPGFSQDFINEYNDALMITYLASMTKGANSINELLDKFNVVHDKHTRRRGFF